MTMLDIFKERMPQGMEIIKVKERNSYYKITVKYNGVEAENDLPKSSTPGCQNKVCDFNIAAIMMYIALKKDDRDMAAEWHNKGLTTAHELIK